MQRNEAESKMYRKKKLKKAENAFYMSRFDGIGRIN